MKRLWPYLTTDGKVQLAGTPQPSSCAHIDIVATAKMFKAILVFNKNNLTYTMTEVKAKNEDVALDRALRECALKVYAMTIPETIVKRPTDTDTLSSSKKPSTKHLCSC